MLIMRPCLLTLSNDCWWCINVNIYENDTLPIAPLAAQEGQGWDSPDEGTASTDHSLAVPKGVVPSRGGQL